MENIGDETLMQLYREGDVQAFTTLYLRHKNSLYRYFTRQVSAPELAEELYQEVWKKLINARLHYQVTSKFTTWLYRIAHNELIDFYRRNATENKVISANIEENDAKKLVNPQSISLVDLSQTSAYQHIENAQQSMHLKACLKQLPREQKEVFLLKHESSFTLKEIAELVGETSEGVKSRLRYALSKLKHCLTFKMGKADE